MNANKWSDYMKRNTQCKSIRRLWLLPIAWLYIDYRDEAKRNDVVLQNKKKIAQKKFASVERECVNKRETKWSYPYFVFVLSIKLNQILFFVFCDKNNRIFTAHIDHRRAVTDNGRINEFIVKLPNLIHTNQIGQL